MSPHNVLLTDTQVLRLGKTFGNSSSDNIKLLRAQNYLKWYS